MRQLIAILFLGFSFAFADDQPVSPPPCYSMINYDGWDIEHGSVAENARLGELLMSSMRLLWEQATGAGYGPPIGHGFQIYVEHDCSQIPKLEDYPEDRQATRAITRDEHRKGLIASRPRPQENR